MGFIIPFPFLLLNKSVHYSIPILIRMVYSYEKEAFFGGGLYRRHTRVWRGDPCLITVGHSVPHSFASSYSFFCMQKSRRLCLGDGVWWRRQRFGCERGERLASGERGRGEGVERCERQERQGPHLSIVSCGGRSGGDS